MIAHTRHELHRQVGQDIDLHYLVLPELVLHNAIGHTAQMRLGILTADVARGDDEVVDKTVLGHHAGVGVDVVALTVVGHHLDDGHTLAHLDADLAALRLIDLRLLDERALQKCLLNLSRADVVHRQRERPDLLLPQHLADLVGRQEAIHDIVLDIGLHLRTVRGSHIGFIERRDGQHQIGGDDDVAEDNEGLLPVDGH